MSSLTTWPTLKVEGKTFQSGHQHSKCITWYDPVSTGSTDPVESCSAKLLGVGDLVRVRATGHGHLGDDAGVDVEITQSRSFIRHVAAITLKICINFYTDASIKRNSVD